jgi:hypothetical protein
MTLKCLAAALIVAGSGAFAAAACAEEQQLTSYADVQRFAVSWAQRGAHVEIAATSKQGRGIPMIAIGTGPIAIVLSNELHANEPASTEAFVRFAELLLGNDAPTFASEVLPGVVPTAPMFRALRDPAVRAELLRRVTIVGFPMLDPDGAENDHTRDQLANSDWATKLTAQSAALDVAMTKYDADLMLDSHGGPDSPDLNVGLIQPKGTEPPIVSASQRAAAVLWRSADALGMKLAYFQEWPFQLLLGTHAEPFASLDEAYYESLSTAPLTQQSYQLDGIPAAYTETVGLQSVNPSISISEGASAQEATMAGLVLEASGLLTGEVPSKRVVDVSGTTLDLPRGATRLDAVARWPRGAGRALGGAGRDFVVTVTDSNGRELARSGSDSEPSLLRASRAVTLESLPVGRYVVKATPRYGSSEGVKLRVVWRTPDTSRRAIKGVLGDPSHVALCIRGPGTLWNQLATQSGGGTPRCSERSATAAPATAQAETASPATRKPRVRAARSSLTARSCIRSRRVTITVRYATRVRVFVGGRRITVKKRGKRFAAVVKLRSHRRRTSVRIVSWSASGRSYTTRRAYRLCTG